MQSSHDATQAIRDLAWVVTSPPLTRPIPEAVVPPEETAPATRAWLRLQQDKPAPLLSHLAQRETRFLGSYFEALWEFWLRSQPHIQLISQRQQIHSRGRTVGEFDIILLDHYRQRFLHQELAVKFYLGLQSPERPAAQWIGPNAADRLDLKLDKLRRQQLRFRENPLAQAWLDSQGITEMDVELIMKGYLFYPFGQNLAAPEEAASNHLRGEWLYLSQLPQLASVSDRWIVLSKRQWLAPARAYPATPWSFPQLCRQVTTGIEANQRALLIVSLKPDGGDWVEDQRFFVVPDSWPNTA